MVIFHVQQPRLDGRIVVEELLSFLKGNWLEDHQAKQIVRRFDSPRRAQFALLFELIDIALVGLQQ